MNNTSRFPDAHLQHLLNGLYQVSRSDIETEGWPSLLGEHTSMAARPRQLLIVAGPERASSHLIGWGDPRWQDPPLPGIKGRPALEHNWLMALPLRLVQQQGGISDGEGRPGGWTLALGFLYPALWLGQAISYEAGGGPQTELMSFWLEGAPLEPENPERDRWLNRANSWGQLHLGSREVPQTGDRFDPYAGAQRRR